MLNKKAGRPPIAERKLSEREHEVLLHLCKGWTDKQIANALGITDQTVKVHMRKILKFLGVSNRTAAVIKVMEQNIYQRGYNDAMTQFKSSWDVVT